MGGCKGQENLLTLEKYYYKAGGVVADCAYRLGGCPNFVTIVSIVVVSFAIWALLKGKYLAFLLLFIFRNILDCSDGYMARKYKMYSKIGDWLDHGSDLIVMLALLAIVIWKVDFSQLGPWLVIAVMFLIIWLEKLHATSLSRINNKKKEYKDSDSLKIFNFVCPDDDLETLEAKAHYLRFIDSGILWTSMPLLVILLFCCFKKKK